MRPLLYNDISYCSSSGPSRSWARRTASRCTPGRPTTTPCSTQTQRWWEAMATTTPACLMTWVCSSSQVWRCLVLASVTIQRDYTVMSSLIPLIGLSLWAFDDQLIGTPMRKFQQPSHFMRKSFLLMCFGTVSWDISSLAQVHRIMFYKIFLVGLGYNKYYFWLKRFDWYGG